MPWPLAARHLLVQGKGAGSLIGDILEVEGPGLRLRAMVWGRGKGN